MSNSSRSYPYSNPLRAPTFRRWLLLRGQWHIFRAWTVELVFLRSPRRGPAYESGASVRGLCCLAVLYQVRDEGVAVVVAPTHPVGRVGGVDKGHQGQEYHYRHEEEADQDKHQEPRKCPTGA